MSFNVKHLIQELHFDDPSSSELETKVSCKVVSRYSRSKKICGKQYHNRLKSQGVLVISHERTGRVELISVLNANICEQKEIVAGGSTIYPSHSLLYVQLKYHRVEGDFIIPASNYAVICG